jgi:hypothetical protein
MDYTFTGVNQASLPLALPAMQFGNAIHRLLQHIAYANPAFGPILLSKYDLSDGYYRIPLQPQAAVELAVVLPPIFTKPLVGIPLVLPMGWRYSPPFFCAYTETVADLANDCIRHRQPLPEHPSEPYMASCPVPLHPLTPYARHAHNGHMAQQPVATVDVYMDDFLGIAQDHTKVLTQRAILHSIDTIFRTHPHPDNPAHRKDTVSRTKLQQGDGTWATSKVMLGWLLDTSDKTLRLPQHKADRLVHLVEEFLPLKRTSRQRWQQLLGELRHIATAIPGAKYLFSILQHVL